MRGGKRPGSGRKSNYDEPTVVISVRVPKSKIQQIKQLINKTLTKWKTKTFLQAE